jgi:cell division protein FtsQ
MKASRRRRSPLARLRPFWMPLALGGALVLLSLGIAATWPGFYPTRIAVIGNHRVARTEILARAAIAPHVSVWFQNAGAMATRIGQIPYVATVRVHRLPPGEILIVVSERVPFAVLRSGSDDVVVDRDLRVLEPAAGDGGLPLLVVEPGLDFTPGAYVRTRDAIELRDAYAAIAAAQIVPARLAFDHFDGLVVTLDNGLELLLGTQDDLDRKLVLANAILKQVVGRERRVAAIDLRAPAAPVLVYR